MAEFSVTAGELRNRAQNLSRLNARLNAQTDLLWQTEQAVCGMWDGEAKDKFHKAFIRDKGKLEEFKKAIDQYVQALEQIARIYEKAEQKNVQMASARRYG